MRSARSEPYGVPPIIVQLKIEGGWRKTTLLFFGFKMCSEVRIDHDLPNRGVAVRGIRAFGTERNQILQSIIP